MKKKYFFVGCLLLVGCKKEADPAPEAKTSAATVASAVAPGAAPTPAAEADFCEVTVSGSAAKKNSGFVSSKRWGDSVEWPVKIFCPEMDLVAYGDDASVPMKPGKYPFFQAGGAKSGVFALFGFEEYVVSGEVDIVSWDDSGIKGSYEAKGSIGTPGTTTFKDGVTISGKFASKKPATRHTPFLSGYCEYTVGDGLPRREAGGTYAIATSHWAGPSTKNSPFPLQLNCGRFNFSANGELEKFPMKPGKFVVDAKNAPGSLALVSPLANPEGALSIEAWDMNGIKGSFEIKGPRMFSTDTTPQLVKGVFDFKCPYTKPGEPCLAKPNGL